MAEEVGGSRARMRHKSFDDMLREALEALGWFRSTKWDDPPGTRQHKPLQLLGKPVDWNEPVEPNLIASSTTNSEIDELEVGSETGRLVVPFVVDIYAESESIGLHLCGDVVDILRGYHPDAGRERATFSLMDYGLATPAPMGYCLITDVTDSRNPTQSVRPWLQSWWIVTCNVTDFYSGSDS